MSLTVRPATTADIPEMVPLLLADADERAEVNPALWALASDAATHIEQALTFALTAEAQPVQQFWRVCADAQRLIGIAHAMLLPVPPIYAGKWGMPGLILPDCCVVPDAPDGTAQMLVRAAEDVLRAAGARLFLSSFVTGDAWHTAFAQAGYAPLTFYLSKSGMARDADPAVRLAVPADIRSLVARSADHRRNLEQIDPFWEAHPDADARFSAWMTRSLTLQDRDMFVQGPSNAVDGYAIAQPASRLHFPAAHDISKTGVFDDFHHTDLRDIETLHRSGTRARALLQTAESALARRGKDTAFVVCPAGWPSKIDLLTQAGYATAMVWSVKR